jgi:hypothetical protein
MNYYGRRLLDCDLFTSLSGLENSIKNSGKVKSSWGILENTSVLTPGVGTADYSFRTKHFPGNARISSRISRVSKAQVN